MAETNDGLGLMAIFSHFSAERELAYVTGYVSSLLEYRPLTVQESQYFDVVKCKACQY